MMLTKNQMKFKLDCSIARLLDCSIARLLDCSIARLLDCSIAWANYVLTEIQMLFIGRSTVMTLYVAKLCFFVLTRERGKDDIEKQFILDLMK